MYWGWLIVASILCQDGSRSFHDKQQVFAERIRRNSYQRAQENGHKLLTLGHLKATFRRVRKMKTGGNDDVRSDIRSTTCSKALPTITEDIHPAIRTISDKGWLLPLRTRVVTDATGELQRIASEQSHRKIHQ